MIEHELTALADRVAPPVPRDLPERVLARLEVDAPRPAPGPRRRGVVAGALAALAAASLLSPEVRAVAADLLGVAGIEITQETPDATPEPRSPLPDERLTSVAEARAAVDFPVGTPARLGPPEDVVVADGGRVVTMTWRDGRVVLDQFQGTLGPVFAKEIGATAIQTVRVGGARARWIGAEHDLTYVDRDGLEVTATARLAGPSLVWETGAGVTLRLEGKGLDVQEAKAIARSVR